MRLLRWTLSLLCLASLVYFSATVELGSRTLIEHVRAIASTREARELATGTRDEAGKVADRVERAIAHKDSQLAPRPMGTPAVRSVDRPAGSPGLAPRAEKSAPPSENLSPEDRAGLDRLAHSKTAAPH